MKLRILLLSTILCLGVVSTQAEVQDTNLYLWPIAGAAPGEGIIYKPRDYIKNEANPCELFIEAEEGSTVLAPCDAEIKSAYYTYNPAILASYSFSMSGDAPADSVLIYDAANRQGIAGSMSEKQGHTIDPKYVSYQVGLDCGKREMLYFSGIRPIKFFKTGTKVQRGDTLGFVGYAYKAVPQPHIMFSRSINTKSADPMGIFGIETSYLPPQAPTIDYLTHKHPAEDLLEDFRIFRTTLEEGHPGLYDYISKTELDEVFDSVAQRLGQPQTSIEFQHLLLEVINEIRDSHTSLYPKKFETSGGAYPPVLFGLKNNKLEVFSAFPEYVDLIGKTIVEINGRSATSFIPYVTLLGTPPDGFITSTQERERFWSLWRYTGRLLGVKEGSKLHLTFADNTDTTLTYKRLTEDIYIPKSRIADRGDERYEIRHIRDDVGYLRLGTFDLLDKDVEDVSTFVAELTASQCNNLIIDLRHNFGGSADVVNELFALIADEPFRSEAGSRVNNNDTYDLFAHTSNYSPDTRDMFPKYTEHHADGWHRPGSDYPFISPNDQIHFGGDVYVLTNCYSISAAAVFPALLRKHKRGRTIGQETGSAYHHLNALKFARVILGTSGLELYMPLVKIVFEERGESDAPWGRGVIPDYPVPLIRAFKGDPDPELTKALDIIDGVGTTEAVIRR